MAVQAAILRDARKSALLGTRSESLETIDFMESIQLLVLTRCLDANPTSLRNAVASQDIIGG